MAGHVDHFSDEIQARHSAALHRLGEKLVSVYASDSNFSLVVAIGAFWSDDPVVRVAFEFGECMVGPALRRVQIEPAIGQPLRQCRPEGSSEGGNVAAGAVAN